MKNRGLLTVLVGTILSLSITSSALNAQDVKSITEIKNTTESKISKAKIEALKSDLKKSEEARVDRNDNTNLRSKNYKQEYQRGKIRTH